VKLSGETANRDFITIVATGEAERGYADYEYIRSQKRVELRVPEDAIDHYG
jgi:hypothetical protein